jgi:hypothetical protein
MRDRSRGVSPKPAEPRRARPRPTSNAMTCVDPGTVSLAHCRGSPRKRIARRATPSGVSRRSCHPRHRASPTKRRSILPISSARNLSAAAIAAMVCRNVLTFDPSETMPPSTAAIAPRATTALDPSRPSIAPSSNPAPPQITTFEARMIFRHRSAVSASSSIRASIRATSSLGSSSSIRPTVLHDLCSGRHALSDDKRTANDRTNQEVVCSREATTVDQREVECSDRVRPMMLISRSGFGPPGQVIGVWLLASAAHDRARQ